MWPSSRWPTRNSRPPKRCGTTVTPSHAATADSIDSAAPFMSVALIADGESPEEAPVVPFRPVRAVRDAKRELAQHVDVLVGRGEVDRLLQIVGRRVIALGSPLRRDRRLRRVRLVADLHGQRGNAEADEAVLIASHEPVSLRLGIRLHGKAEIFRD